MANPISSVTLPYQLLLSFALGNAAAPAIRPFAQSLENDAWAAHRVLPPTIYTTAPAAARGKIPVSSVQGWGHSLGYSDDVIAAIMDGSRTSPDLADLFEMWRRSIVDQAGFEQGLVNLGVMRAWWSELEQLKRVHLSPAEAANARQQQFITAAEQRATAALFGIEPADADVQFELAGLPPGIETGLAMWRRGIIDQATFDRIVAEGHTKTKYTGDLEQLFRQLLQPSIAVRARLKGHITPSEMHARGAEWGYTPADMDLWELAEGRPATPHQIHIGYMRGATLPGAANERDAIQTAVEQSDTRPEYGDLIYAGRETYPSLFQLNRLVTANAITAQTAASWARKAGMAQEVVTVLETYWTSLAGGSTADPHVSKADTQLWTTLHKAYLGSVVDAAHVQQGFTLLGVAPSAQPVVLERWTFERDLERRRLTPAQVKKALGEGVINPATGQPWTHDEAIAYLVELGMGAEDAQTFLDI